jgi:hypothetical protein
VRETREEAGIASSLEAAGELGHVDYDVGAPDDAHVKRVRYFALACARPVELAPLPARTRERRWITRAEIDEVPLVNDALRPILVRALEAKDPETRCSPGELVR